MGVTRTVFLAILAGVVASVAAAQDRGPVTNLPLPRYVSMKAAEGNVRRGPGLTHKIDWIFKHRDMPLEITAEHGHWRRVRDIDGAGGWMHYTLLSGVRTVIIQQDLMPIFAKPDAGTQVNAHLELGVVARLGECDPTWCRLTADGHRGWALKDALWGVGEDEVRQ